MQKFVSALLVFGISLSYPAVSNENSQSDPCRSGILEAAGVQVPEIHILVEGAGDVVERFYLPALRAVALQQQGRRKVFVTFADFVPHAQWQKKNIDMAKAIDSMGFRYLNKAIPEQLAEYKKADPDYVFLAIPSKMQTKLVKEWRGRGLPPIRIFTEKPVEDSPAAAKALAEMFPPGDDSVLAIDHYRPKLKLQPGDIQKIEAFLGGIASFECYVTEDRSGSDKKAAFFRTLRDGAIENEDRTAVLHEGEAADLAPHVFAILEYFANTHTLTATKIKAGRYKGVDGDPEKPATILTDTYFAAEVAVQDNHGNPITGKITVGKGLRVKKYGPELAGEAKVLELVGKNGARVVFDLRGKGEGASLVTYFNPNGVPERSEKLESRPYDAIVNGVVEGKSHTNQLAFSLRDGANFREQLAKLTAPIRAPGVVLPLYPGGMGGVHERPAPYVEDLWNDLPAFADRDFLMIGGAGVMGKGFSHRIAQVAGANLVVLDPSPNASEVLKTLGADANVLLAPDLPSAIASLKRPRRMMLLVSNDKVTESILNKLSALLEPGDVVIDGGNNLWTNTERRQKLLAEKGIHLIGMGVSGGERGAWNGSSMMPGGDPQAYELVRPILEQIAARVPDILDPAKEVPSVSYIGPGGAGHFVKMTHNGIEYVEMQLLAEAYDILRKGLKMPNAEMAKLFAAWNETELKSFLLGVTAKVVNHPDALTGKPLVEVIKPLAKQKGTGKWTTDNALELGAYAPTLAEAVFARNATVFASEGGFPQLAGPRIQLDRAQEAFLLDALPRALYAARVLDFAQGLHLISLASKERFEGKVDLVGLTNTWRTGSILQGHLLDDIHRAFRTKPIANLLESEPLQDKLSEYQGALRDVVGLAQEMGIPVPAFSSLLSYYDTIRSSQLPANLLQAMRDYFGGHTFERTDQPGTFHDDWGDPASTTP